MEDRGVPLHYVCTHDQARELAAGFETFWVSNCGCREGREEGCARSRIDVCLMFAGDIEASGSGLTEIAKGDLDEIFDEATSKQLVTRPFRGYENRSKTEGICFCCDDCCGYFLDPAEVCDKGTLIEKTATDACTDCGLCPDVCYFHAREMKDGKLVVTRELCYGCGLCVDVCPERCIEMIGRK